ncbi:P-loop containing nucleoside triphosphate hydrolase protein [Suillus subalutaceus]|uniref:P-loop containing nucleoside triphosphate hydrolase protein n=1 Tax=Suillus subalutaceus TaxID=48586 RepID=UPI001B86F2D4|nr:P-loop containing nucleoside triphosphate hydrolase protein [Suillus subalutaceus]KAG1832866.1 P-loop containing nucleoside triphosphate hydrolase protein [Suillus subalutaceus]
MVERRYNIRPCNFQIQSAIEQLKCRDVITVAPTGAGKTLTFWIPLLFTSNAVMIVITALNGLGDQNVEELNMLVLTCINVTGQNVSDELFKEIEDLRYRVVIISPELVISDKRVENEWGKEFRPEYSQLGRLRWILPSHIKFHVVSATMPSRILKDVMATLNMRHENITKIRLSNDRPNIHLVVIEMQYSTKSMHDINRVLRLEKEFPPPKFLIFCNSRRETQRVAMFLRGQLSSDFQERIVWFHSGMTAEFRASALDKLRKGEVWGICCTDAAGMVPWRNVSLYTELIIQWGYVKSLCVLMQRLGRAARSPRAEATGVYIIDKNYRNKAGKVKTKAGNKWKSNSQGGSATKRTRVMVNEDQEMEGGAHMDHHLDSESDNLDSESESEEETVTQLSEAPTGQANRPSKLLPSSSGLSEDEYEMAAMEVFLEAHRLSVCWRKVANEYFGNDLISTCFMAC